jgi:SulP family sulfate permease
MNHVLALPKFERMYGASPIVLVYSFLLSVMGIAVFGTLISLINNYMRNRVEALRRGDTPVLERGHVLVLGWSGVATIDDLGVATGTLPLPVLPDPALVPALLLPAISLAFVGLIQGASISASFPNPDGRYPDTSRDFSGQGVANVAAGVFQGMPLDCAAM